MYLLYMDYIRYMGEYLGNQLLGVSFFKGTHIFPLIKQAEKSWKESSCSTALLSGGLALNKSQEEKRKICLPKYELTKPPNKKIQKGPGGVFETHLIHVFVPSPPP